MATPPTLRKRFRLAPWAAVCAVVSQLVVPLVHDWQVGRDRLLSACESLHVAAATDAESGHDADVCSVCRFVRNTHLTIAPAVSIDGAVQLSLGVTVCAQAFSSTAEATPTCPRAPPILA